MCGTVIWQHVAPCWDYFVFCASQNIFQWWQVFRFSIIPHVRTVVLRLEPGGMQVLFYTRAFSEMPHSLEWLELEWKIAAGGSGFCEEEVFLLYCLKSWHWESDILRPPWGVTYQEGI